MPSRRPASRPREETMEGLLELPTVLQHCKDPKDLPTEIGIRLNVHSLPVLHWETMVLAGGLDETVTVTVFHGLGAAIARRPKKATIIAEVVRILKRIVRGI
jgi:hypothetical protein